MRALLEVVLTIIAIVIARAILTSVMRGFVNAGRAASAPPQAAAQNAAPQQNIRAGELHKDPVCGTYVAESTPFRRQASGQTFYYCSSDCKEKHAVLAR